ncbi:MAG: hypothetical protein UX09_C0002G0001 [Candidatus Uhrbacteria bacterium GW2011_GWE2_45_35]|uniref:Uncharacterized protein n=1 Tax=Candidatus Uhrbacteria bacterium GW2011_GWE2_45_35 TaxID=1618993 RepID=A0A0G1PUM1_9BACT|nr:MAG: hypothetical protein UX09_C0002G0001 [Candidatus Uhrbacteria bacterium GW2011_GWE2_45_35]
MDQEIKQEFENLTSLFQQGFKKHDEDIENLSVMVQQGFEEVNQKFAIVDIKLEETNQKIDQTTEKISQLYINVDGFIHMHQRLDLELTAMRGYYQRLEERIAKLETAHS